MCASINKVILVGNVGARPEARRTSSGKLSVKLRVATNHRWKDEAGVAREEVEWHTVKVYGAQADACERYLDRGRPVAVEGRLHYYTWEDDKKEKRSITEVVATNVQFLGRAHTDAQAGGPHGAQAGGQYGGQTGPQTGGRALRPAPPPPAELDVADVPF